MIAHLFYLPTFQTFQSYFAERSSFLRIKAFFLRLKFSRGTTSAAVIGQAVVALNLEFK